MKKLIIALLAILVMLVLAPKSTPNVVLQGAQTEGDDATPLLVCPTMTGTGVVLTPTKVITAAHVLGSDRTCYIRGARDQINLRAIEVDRRNDFAVLETQGHTFRRTYRIDCGGFVPGETYYVSGYANGIIFRVNPLVAINLQVSVDRGDGNIVLQAMNGESTRGMSGGPVVDIHGNVVGILVGHLRNDTSTTLVKDLGHTSVCR